MAKPKFLYDNRFADATPVASTTAAGFNVLNLADFRPYTWWKGTALPATVTVDCGSAKSADYALVYGHDLGTNGCTIELRGSTDNFAASDVLVASSTPTDDEPILLTFASASYRYWRWRITGAGAVPSLAIAVAGVALESPVHLQDSFNPIDRDIEGQSNRNENGLPLGKIIDYEEWSADIRLVDVSWTWARATFLPAWKAHLRGSPFGFIWDSDLYPEDVILVQSGDSLDMPHRAGSFCTVSFELTGVHPT